MLTITLFANALSQQLGKIWVVTKILAPSPLLSFVAQSAELQIHQTDSYRRWLIEVR